MALPPKFRAGASPLRVVVVGDTCVSEQGLATIVRRDKRYHICGGAHGFYDARELIRKHRPDILLIEPFLEDRDGLLWIKELAIWFLKLFGKSVRMAALALIALAGCGLSFAGIDWDGNPDTPNSIDIVFASPIALEIEPSAPLTPEIISIRLGPVQNFYCFHEHVPERAPPILS